LIFKQAGMEVVLNQFIGYSLKAPDGYVGNICDFYFDSRTWTIRYLVGETGNWIRKEALISPLALLEPHCRNKNLSGTDDQKEDLSQSQNSTSEKNACSVRVRIQAHAIVDRMCYQSCGYSPW
jgi:hypothetical protein